MSKVDITAALTAHAEGVLLGPSLASFEQSIETARQAGLSVEGLIVLDRPNAATRLQFGGGDSRYRFIETDEGDPGQARNAAVRAARGEFVSFLDGDDLWSRNWLINAHEVCAAEPLTAVAHSEINIIFGRERLMFWHIDSRGKMFDPDFLRFNNYWDAMCFASREILERHPFKANDLSSGFAHEDWHWNCETISAGIAHRPAKGTVHFKRRREGSQIMKSRGAKSIPWVTPLASYAWVEPLQGF